MFLKFIPQIPAKAVAAAKIPTERETSIDRQVERTPKRRSQVTFGGLVEDLALALLVVFLFPIVILVLGWSMALIVRVVIEIARWML